MRPGWTVTASAVCLALLAVTSASAQGVGAQPTAQGGDVEVSLQPAGQAGNAGIQPAGDEYLQPGAGEAGGDEGAGDLAAVDYGDPADLGDINIRVPVTLTNLHEDIVSWYLDCVVHARDQGGIGSGSTGGEVVNGGFSGLVLVSIDLAPEYAPQDVWRYGCYIELRRTNQYLGVMVKEDGADPKFRALPGSTTYRQYFPEWSIYHGDGNGMRRVVGTDGRWELE